MQPFPKGLAYAFDARLAPHYERHMSLECGYQTPDRLAEGVAPHARTGARFLDLGAGSGLVGKALLRLGLSVDVVAVDISEAMLALIDCPLYVERHRADARLELPFDDDVFDGVLAAGLLEHISDPALLLSNALRVKKPRGILAFSYPPSPPGHTPPGDFEDGLVSHDAEATRRCLARLGASILSEAEYPAYRSGSGGWVTHRLIVAV